MARAASLLVGFAAVLIAALVGDIAGSHQPAIWAAPSTLLSCRIADVQISFPAILIALLIDGVLRGIAPPRPARRSPGLRAYLRNRDLRLGPLRPHRTWIDNGPRKTKNMSYRPRA